MDNTITEKECSLYSCSAKAIEKQGKLLKVCPKIGPVQRNQYTAFNLKVTVSGIKKKYGAQVVQIIRKTIKIM